MDKDEQREQEEMFRKNVEFLQDHGGEIRDIISIMDAIQDLVDAKGVGQVPMVLDALGEYATRQIIELIELNSPHDHCAVEFDDEFSYGKLCFMRMEKKPKSFKKRMLSRIKEEIKADVVKTYILSKRPDKKQPRQNDRNDVHERTLGILPGEDRGDEI